MELLLLELLELLELKLDELVLTDELLLELLELLELDELVLTLELDEELLKELVDTELELELLDSSSAVTAAPESLRLRVSDFERAWIVATAHASDSPALSDFNAGLTANATTASLRLRLSGPAGR